ncbi:MAG TPA: hypothetical protein DEZ08_06485 [Dehalococcoidia bacterium]|jgi:tetratricopeptide (TPR) repeat protein|nr:hypothetical protein [Dehalococcoidia bacterium]
MQQPEIVEPSMLPIHGTHGFVGRQAEYLAIESLIEDNPVIHITGSPGCGKTQLILEYARKNESTKTYPGSIFYSEIGVGSNFARLIHEIGSTAFGVNFGDLKPSAQYEKISEYLLENKSLIIWDDSHNTQSLWSDSEIADLITFLKQFDKDVISRIVIVGNNEENNAVQSAIATSYTLQGLNAEDQMAFVSSIMAENEFSNLSESAKSSIFELTTALQGHPLGLEILTPLLKDTPPNLLVKEMNIITNEHRSPLRMAFELFSNHASYRIRTHLPLIYLFKKRVMLDVLTHFTQSSVYQKLLKEELGWGATRALLRTAKDSGILSAISPSVYQIPNSIPSILGEKLYKSLTPDSIKQLEQEFVRIYVDTADHFLESLEENPDSGATAILAEEQNIIQALGLALEDSKWEEAQILMQPIAQIYKMQKRFTELDMLRITILDITGAAYDTAAANGSIEIWEYIKGTTSSDWIERNHLTEAEETCQELIHYLENENPENKDLKLATVYTQLGEIYLTKRNLQTAEVYLEKANEIYTVSQAEENSAQIYQYLGKILYYKGQYSDAKTEYNKALDIHQQSDNQEEMVNDYRFLGLLSQLQLKYDEAESWYKQAQGIAENHGDEETAMLIYHDLGTLFHAQYYFEEAQSWYRQALHLSDRLEFKSQMAREFHYLGLLSQDRGQLEDEAEEWFVASLEQKLDLEDLTGCGDECRQIGLLYHEQEKFTQANQWYKRAADYFSQSSSIDRLARTYGQIGVISEELNNIEEALEWTARTYTLISNNNLPMANHVLTHLKRLREKIGHSEFSDWWKNNTGDEPPIALIESSD